MFYESFFSYFNEGQLVNICQTILSFLSLNQLHPLAAMFFTGRFRLTIFVEGHIVNIPAKNIKYGPLVLEKMLKVP